MAVRIFGISFLIFLLFGCSGISTISSNKSDFYRDKFLERIGGIKEQYRQGRYDFALKTLRGMKEGELWPSEKSLRRNLIGVILFSKRKFEKAIYNFDLALSSSQEDESLTVQIYLNLASCYYKLGLMDKAYTTISMIDFRKLSIAEAKKHHLLKYNLSKDLGKEGDELITLVRYLSDKQKIEELKSNPYFEYLLSGFLKLSRSEKIRFLEEFEDDNFLCISYLGYLEVEKLYYGGNKDAANDLLEWVGERSKSFAEIFVLIKGFSFRISNDIKMDSEAIGIILPLSGKKKHFGKRALLGIDSGFKELLRKTGKKYKLYIKDSRGSGAVGAFNVTELIEKHHVSAIIGGLFSTEATKEYLQAKKYGAFFISLSQIYIPKNQKDHLLLEIPGSVESLVCQMFSDKMLQKFGTNAAIVYPKSAKGNAYISEFWRMAINRGVKVTGVLSYDKNKTDYRDTVKNLLNLKFPRERKEELEIVSEIHRLEERNSARRIQNLRPQVDFDWIFLPSFPKDALQLIPSFAYFDAYGLKLIGDSSWRSKALSKESRKLGPLFFIGDDVNQNGNHFSENFVKLYKKRPRLIEMRAYDALKIVDLLFDGSSFSTREELDISINSKKLFRGITGKWVLSDGIWLKEMVSLKLSRGKIQKTF